MTEPAMSPEFIPSDEGQAQDDIASYIEYFLLPL